MHRKMYQWIVVCGLLVVALAAVITTAQPDRAAAAAGAAREEGRYFVTAGGSSYILHDATAGTAWVYFPDPKEKKPVMVPVRRLTSTAEIEAHKLGVGN
ncbi:MAG: hypothetical protein BWX88_00898 [Planctomycetes bacterium ADurb.Bin126]|nr:MAG: hypothetical protein BWX88_00898 [Planctomycetes bacterium ADurb.Bin126]HOD83401.1 hypothetical protein [Phycisphaerae bacterium]HQL74183.1 hypothetical protein [Phycisphaerae bacterium]